MDQPTVQYAIVELFGHQRLAGRISEQTIGGQSFVRIDVPEVRYPERDFSGPERIVVVPAHTRSFGAGAIYAINWVDEAAATAAAHEIRHQPVTAYSLASAFRTMSPENRQRLLAGPALEMARGDQDEIPY